MSPIDTPTPGPEVPDDFDDSPAFDPGNDLPGPSRPINWSLLSAADLEAELLELNRWVDWLRHTYGLPASVIPPMWHRHPELLWELSALHLHWLLRLRPRAERFRTAGLAPRLRRHPPAPPRLGSHQRHPPGPRPTNPSDHLAR